MADIICVIGSKGGTGKTTLAQMLCHGLGLFGQRSMCVVTTDGENEPFGRPGQSYQFVDARNPDAWEETARIIRENPHVPGIFDGESNNPLLDQRLYALADLVLLPFRDSHEDIRIVLRDLEKFPRAYAVPSQWPTNQWQQRVAGRLLQELLGHHQDRILEPVYALSPTKLLLQKQVPEALPSSMNEACRNFAKQILDLLTIRICPVGISHAIQNQKSRIATV